MNRAGPKLPDAMMRPRPWFLGLSTLALFGIWSNSFIVVSFLLGGDAADARLDWISLTAARFFPAAVLTGGYCLLFRRADRLG